MLSMVKWLSVPIGAVVVAAWIAFNDWFDNGWVVVAYFVVVLLTLYQWRRATYRLLPPDWDTYAERLGPTVKRKVALLWWSIFIGSLVVSLSALLIMVLLLWSESLNQSRSILIIVIMMVDSFSKFGVFYVLVRRILDRQEEIVNSDSRSMC